MFHARQNYVTNITYVMPYIGAKYTIVPSRTRAKSKVLRPIHIKYSITLSPVFSCTRALQISRSTFRTYQIAQKIYLLKGKVFPVQFTKVCVGSRGITPLILNPGTRRRRVVYLHAPASLRQYPLYSMNRTLDRNSSRTGRFGSTFYTFQT